MFYFAYKVGAWLLGRPPQQMQVELTFEWLGAQLGYIWAPMLMGSLLIGLTSAVLGFFSVRLLWRLHVIRSWQDRKRRRNEELRASPPASSVAKAMNEERGLGNGDW